MTDSPKKTRFALKIILPLLIIIVGVVGFKMLTQFKKAPHRQPPQQQGVLVDVVTPVSGDFQVTVHATGTVHAAQEITIVPEVSGKVVEISKNFVNGGQFSAGATMIKIDPRNYQLALQKARAEIAQVQVALATEQERAKIAINEWQSIDIEGKGEPGPLVTHEIQLKQQQANLAAAEANVKLAELNLERTVIKAPFNGRISQKQVDLGQLVHSGGVIGKLSATDRAEIYVPLPYSEIQWLNVPAANSQQHGSTAAIFLPGEKQSHWQGEIVRSLGEIDPTTRMATVVIAIANPYSSTGNQLNLETGMFVDVQIKGKALDNVVAIPRKALRNNQQIWVVDKNNRLKIKSVDIVRREKDQLLVSHGISAEDRIITTSLSGAADGMLLRPAAEQQQ